MDTKKIRRTQLTQVEKMWLSHLIKTFVSEFKHHTYLKNGLVKLYNDTLFGIPCGRTFTVTVNELIDDLLIEAIVNHRASNSENKIDTQSLTQELQCNILPQLKKGNISEAIRILMKNYFDKESWEVFLNIKGTMVRINDKGIKANQSLSPDDVLYLSNIQNRQEVDVSKEMRDKILKVIAQDISYSDNSG